MKAKRASGFAPISRSTASAVASSRLVDDGDAQQRALRAGPSSCLELRRHHSPRPLKRLTSTLALRLEPDFISSSLCASSRA